jgi:hypothetical protein
VSKTAKHWYLKQRFNPQLGTYWIKCGQIGKREAMSAENSLYGHNKMHGFATEAEYLAAIERLKSQGERVQ